ncbi:MAG: hypothetical protein ACYTFI_04785 [Planctomycetota bacterium]
MESSETRVKRARDRFDKREKLEGSAAGSCVGMGAGCTISGAFLVLLLMVLLYPLLPRQTGPPVDNLFTAQTLPGWMHAKAGLSIHAVRIVKEPKDGGPPRLTLRAVNTSGDRKLFAVFFVFYDEGKELLATVSFSPEAGTAGIGPGKEEELSQPLYIPRSEVDRISYYSVRVRQAKLSREDNPKKEPASVP